MYGGTVIYLPNAVDDVIKNGLINMKIILNGDELLQAVYEYVDRRNLLPKMENAKSIKIHVTTTEDEINVEFSYD